MKDVNERFRNFLEKTGLSPTKLAHKIGVNHESINRLMRDPELPPSINILIAIKHYYPSLNINHIITGEGDLFITDDYNNKVELMKKEINNLKKSIDEKDEIIGNLSATVRNLTDEKKKNSSSSNEDKNIIFDALGRL